MQFIALASEQSYNHKDFKPVSIERRRQSCYWNELYAEFTDYKVGEIVTAGWMDIPVKAFKSKITKIVPVPNDFDDERTWKITLIRIKEIT